MTRADRSQGGSPLVLAGLLDDLNAVGPSRMMGTVMAALAGQMAVTGVRLLMADLEESRFEPRADLSAGPMAAADPIPIEGTRHGEVYLSGTMQEVDAPEPLVIAPVSTRREREGVLEARLSCPPTPEDVALIGSVATLIGYLINAADRWTDEFHVTRRTRPMSLAAEIQWGLLPLSAFSCPEISLAGAIEPAYDVGGDVFDYACGTRTLFGGVFDAMGHGVRAARLSGLAVAVYRNARRAGGDLIGQGSALHDALAGSFAAEGYVTGTLVKIDLSSPDRSAIVRAGHPAPLLQRGSAAAAPLPVQGGLPFGVPFDNQLHAEPLELEAGDRLVLYTDGVVEAQPEDGEAFGLSMLVPALQEVRGASAREAARAVVRKVRAYRAQDLSDDATVVIIDIPARV